MSWNRGKVKYPENPTLGKWQPPKLKMPLSLSQIKRLWNLRCELQKRGIELKKQGVQDLTQQLANVLRQLEDEFSEYDDFDLKFETDPVNKTWHKANHTLMIATWPLVQTGRIPLECRMHNWFKENIGASQIYRLQAILWYKAAYWGFEQWRDYTYQKYWDKREEKEMDEYMEAEEAEDIKQFPHSEDDWQDWYSDYYEQMRLFLRFLTLLGYTDKEAWYIREHFGWYLNE